MRFPRVFALLFSLSAGFALAATIAGTAFFQGTSLERFAPPQEVTQYQPPPLGIPLIGDFLWALGILLRWFGSVPAIASELMAALGVPPLLIAVLSAVIAISFAAYIIYLVSGRVLSL